jgi:ferritin-like metal-binding protein YciE
MEKLLERVNQKINKQTDAFRLLDKTLIELCQKMTHYEILAYGTVVAFAELLKDTRALALLMKTLEEEKAVEEKLIQFGSTDVIRTPDAFGNPKLEGPSMREELNTNDSLGG